MKHTICSILFVGLAGVLSSCSSTATNKQATTRVEMKAESKASKSTSGGSVETQLWNDVNAYRASIGMKPLQRHAGLDSLARQHCNYLAQHRGEFGIYGKNVSHVGFDGRYATAKYKYSMSTISENVIYGEKIEGNAAQTLLDAWKKSKNHDSNMRQKWELSGIAVVRAGDGMYYATQIFAVPGSTQSRWAGPQF